MKCVFDENMPIKLCRALNYLEGEHGIQVKHMTELVSPRYDTPRETPGDTGTEGKRWSDSGLKSGGQSGNG
jgi:hypothetical protein